MQNEVADSQIDFKSMDHKFWCSKLRFYLLIGLMSCESSTKYREC